MGNRYGKLTHGHVLNGVTSGEYNAWSNMKARCSNADHPSFDRYGGRGITVCDAWQNFEAFLADMGERPTPEHTLERIDNDGNYEPGNCRWATRAEQSVNRSTNRIISVNGISMTVSQWAARLKCKHHVITKRLSRGWSPELAVTEPVRSNRYY